MEHKEVLNGANHRLIGTADFSGGYFGEIFAEYQVPPFSMAGLVANFSFFCKASVLHATAIMNLKDPASPLLTPADFDFSLDRNLFILGGKAVLNFDLPGLPGFGLL